MNDGLLKFLGTGSCFNTKLGNNSAYLIKNQNLYLFDCGGDVFGKLKEKILKSNALNKIYAIITHTHSDHIASLPDLIFYSYHILGKYVCVIHPDNKIRDLLDLMGVGSFYYDYEDFSFSNGFFSCEHNKDLKIFTYEVAHSPPLSSFGYLIMHDKEFYYSGDAKEIPYSIIERLERGNIDAIYQDTSSFKYDSNPHLSLEELCNLIKPQFRDKVWCMHLDEYFDYHLVEYLGFNYVKPI